MHRLVPLAALSLGLLGLVGCGMSDDAFIEKASKVGCDQMKSCDPDEFDAQYDDMGECRDVSEAGFGFLLLMGCSLEGSAGERRGCIKDMKKASCDGEEESADCNAVIVCDGGGIFDDFSTTWSDTGT